MVEKICIASVFPTKLGLSRTCCVGMANEMMLKKAKLLQKHRIRYGLYTMVGLPTETMENALETVKLSVKLKGHILFQHHSIFFPFPSTPLSDYCISQGVLSDRNLESYFEDTKLDMAQFPRE